MAEPGLWRGCGGGWCLPLCCCRRPAHDSRSLQDSEWSAYQFSPLIKLILTYKNFILLVCIIRSCHQNLLTNYVKGEQNCLCTFEVFKQYVYLLYVLCPFFPLWLLPWHFHVKQANICETKMKVLMLLHTDHTAAYPTTRAHTHAHTHTNSCAKNWAVTTSMNKRTLWYLNFFIHQILLTSLVNNSL